MLGIYCRTSKANPLDKVSTIEQQVKKGIEFASSRNLDYVLYQDEGISGFVIEEDEEQDPFKNRPQFSKLINDIRAGRIDSVWVWEHSRISRNNYASAYIFNIFDKFKIKLYEKDKEFNLADPTNQMLRQILDAVAQYERQLIVGRTTRGFYNAIDSGRRAHAKFFGYRKSGVRSDGKLAWVPVESEINSLKSWYKDFMNGATLRSIVIKDITTSDNKLLLKRVTKLGRFLAHAEYTGYCLNTKGLEILHKFEKQEIQSLDVLHDMKYWVKSLAYTEQLITIDEWIQVRERLQRNKVPKEQLKRRAEKSLATGIVQCSCCKSYYYYRHINYKNHGKKTDYTYYTHNLSFNDKSCSNKPKTIQYTTVDTILEIFFFYFVLVFDASKKVIEESLEQQDIERQAVRDVVSVLNAEKAQAQRQIQKFNDAIDNTEDLTTITVLAKRISAMESKLVELDMQIADKTVELDKMNKVYEQTELKRRYFSLKDIAIKFHESTNIEDKRNNILKTVDDVLLFGRYLLIRANRTIFLFDIKMKYVFPQDMFDKLKNDTTFYEAITSQSATEIFELIRKDNPDYAVQQSMKFNNKLIRYTNLVEFDSIYLQNSARKLETMYLEEIGIKYDLTSIDNVVYFNETKELQKVYNDVISNAVKMIG